jgi:hypothetical protein
MFLSPLRMTFDILDIYYVLSKIISFLMVFFQYFIYVGNLFEYIHVVILINSLVYKITSYFFYGYNGDDISII